MMMALCVVVREEEMEMELGAIGVWGVASSSRPSIWRSAGFPKYLPVWLKLITEKVEPEWKGG